MNDVTPVTPGAKRAVVMLFVLSLMLNAANLLWTAHEVNSAAAAQRREQVTAQRAGQAVAAKLCKTLGKLAALQPPPGSAQANPSRAYEQQLHETLSQLGPDIGCK